MDNLPKELIDNILLFCDVTSIIKFIFTSKLYYEIRNNLYLLENTINNNGFVELWNEISQFHDRKNRYYVSFFNKLRKNIERHCKLEAISLFNGIVRFYIGTNGGLFNSIDYFNLFTNTPLSFYYFLHEIKNWNKGCMYMYKRGNNKDKFCLKGVANDSYHCMECMKTRRYLSTIYLDQIIVLNNEILGDMIVIEDNTYRELTNNYIVYTTNFKSFNFESKVINDQIKQLNEEDKKHIVSTYKHLDNIYISGVKFT